MAKFTPGPWTVRFSNVMAGNWCIAPCGGRSSNREPEATEIYNENYANARLIAAAPEMYQELSIFLRLLEPYEQDGTLSDRVPGLATLNGIREALRKAEANGK